MEDFELPEPRIKCVSNSELEMEMGDKVRLINFTLKYDDDKVEYYLEESLRSGVEILERNLQWTPSIDILCADAWMFEGAYVNVTIPLFSF